MIDKKQYDLVISLTEGDEDPSHLFYRCSAFLAKGQLKESLDCLLRNREALYKLNPALTLKSDFELRFLNKDFDGAYEDLQYFTNQPYVSQEVEEYLRALPSIIRTNERNAQLAITHTPEEIKKILHESQDDYEVLSLLEYIHQTSSVEYDAYLLDILTSKRHPSVKTYALLLLVSQGYAQEVTFNKNGQVYRLVPKELKPPYTGEPFNSFTRKLAEMARDPSVYQTALKLLNDFILDSYPSEVIHGPEDNVLAVALLKLAQEYLRSSLGIEGYLASTGAEKADVEALAQKIESTLKAYPPLSI